jgi:hypothetical protein
MSASSRVQTHRCAFRGDDTYYVPTQTVYTTQLSNALFQGKDSLVGIITNTRGH